MKEQIERFKTELREREDTVIGVDLVLEKLNEIQPDVPRYMFGDAIWVKGFYLGHTTHGDAKIETSDRIITVGYGDVTTRAAPAQPIDSSKLEKLIGKYRNQLERFIRIGYVHRVDSCREMLEDLISLRGETK